jgi:hypothetical protein
MSSVEISHAQERKPRQRRTRTNVNIESFTVDQYCDACNTSRTKLYAAWRAGGGPRFYLHGTRRRISRAAGRGAPRRAAGGSRCAERNHSNRRLDAEKAPRRRAPFPFRFHRGWQWSSAVLLRPNPTPPQLPPEKLLELLANPVNAGLSNREISRRLEVDHKFVAGFRAALAATAWAPPEPGAEGHAGVGPSHGGLLRPSGTPSKPGRTVAGEPPALNSWDCWVLATPRERTKFVDAVGLFKLLAAAPPDHRSHFRRTIIAEIAMAGMTRVTPLPTAPVSDIPADLSIPAFLRRPLTPEAQAHIDAIVAEDRAKGLRS